MTNLPIPVIEGRGTPYQVGYQIGVAARESLHSQWEEMQRLYGAQWRHLKALAAPFAAATQEHLPRVMQELRGGAEGAGIPFDDLFLMSVEELLYEEVRGKGCSDLAAAPPATADGHVWLVHNNDLSRSTRDHLFITRFCVQGEPEIYAVTVGGLFISIGLNEAGIALTGNQLTANDSRVGVPRLLIVRELLAQRTLEGALDVALLPARASSYNNIIASRDGLVVNVEGSATAYALTTADAANGTIVHTNHYLAPEMQRFEAEPHDVLQSAARCARARDYAEKYHGRIAFDVCARFSRDHVYAPWSVCRHAGESVTVFGAIIDLTELKLWLARGNPCQNEYVLYPLGDKSG